MNAHIHKIIRKSQLREIYTATFAEVVMKTKENKRFGTKHSRFDIRYALSEMQGTMKRGAILKRPVLMFKRSNECTPLYTAAAEMKKMTPCRRKVKPQSIKTMEMKSAQKVDCFLRWLALILFSPLKFVAFIHRRKNHCLQTPQRSPKVTCGDLFSPSLWPLIEVCMSLPLCEKLILVAPGGVNELRSRWLGCKLRMMSSTCETV